jgi:hypothetical protein
MGILKVILLTAGILPVLVQSSQAATYLVVNTADGGAGSLRWAIQSANASAGTDTVAFAIPGAGPHTIAPSTALPSVTDRVVIDGYTQTGAVPNTNPITIGVNAVLQIELNGVSAWTGGASGALDIRSGGSVVRGLVIGRWDIPGVHLGGSGGHTVVGCFIGSTTYGTAGLPNTVGIDVTSNGNVIGGTSAAARNLISGNAGEGLYIGGDSTVVSGNFIGTDITGTAALANGNAGVHIELGSNNNIGGGILPSRNLISGNSSGISGDGDGVWINGGTGNKIRGNYIGVDVTGLSGLANAGNGVYIENSLDGWVGGAAAAYRNIISGNLENGVSLAFSTAYYSVSGNYIGTDASGMTALGNGMSGVLTWNSQYNMIGGHSTGHRNVISGNSDDGVSFNSTADTVQANYIGTDTSGTGPLPNGQAGVRLNALGSVVGKTAGASPTGTGNVIAFNVTDGVIVESSYFNSVRANTIHSNLELGIDLADDGVTLNDDGDVDNGPNNLQNYPVLTSAAVGWNHTRVTGELNSTPSESHWVDFYSNTTCDASGYGEGETYIGSVVVVTDAFGYASIDECFSVYVPAGRHISATATYFGCTSEFSMCVEVTNGLIVTNANPSGPGSLVDAVANCAACPGTDAITFNIPGAGPHTISPTSPLSIGAWDLLDGYSQFGSSENTKPLGMGTNAVLMIELDLSSSQVILDNGHSRIRGLAINRCPTAGVLIQSDSNGVDGCFIGTDPTGTTAKPNNTGIRTEFFGHNVIGGDIAARLNLISGNTLHGIHLQTDNNIVKGNLIGTDPTGTGALGTGNGIYLNDADKSHIGGTSMGERNIISGGHDVGLYISGNSAWSIVEGNFIGTDVTGTVGLQNTVGVVIDGGADNNRIGGTAYGARNVISGNSFGVDISGSLTTSNNLWGNRIGRDVNALPLGNTNVGVRIFESSGNSIGGSARGAGNAIAFNGTIGVLLDPGSGSADNPILGNMIYDNGGLGIDWGNDGVTANGLPDGYQDFPVLTSVLSAPGSTIIATNVGASPWTDVTVQYFDNAVCDPSGNGEGWRLLGDTLVTTNALGSAQFIVTLPLGVCGGYVTATATIATETSEFSACLLAINTPAGSDVVVEPRDEFCQSPAILTFSNVTSGGFTSLSYSDSCPDVPVGFLPGDSAVCYEFATTASFTKTVQVCIEYNEAILGGPENDLRLLYTDTLSVPPDWADITSSVDTLNNVICGSTSGLGTFLYAVTDLSTGVTDGTRYPDAFALYQNVPNPFNPTTIISYDVPAGVGKVTLRIYDVRGRLVRTLVDGVQTPGEKRVVWYGRDNRGNRVATGVYFYRMTAPGVTVTKKMLLLR